VILPGRCRGGKIQILVNALTIVALFAGTHALALGSVDLNPGAWAAPWSGDVILVSAGLLFLGLAFLLPLHGGLLNLGIHAQFLVGFAVGAAIGRGGLVDPAGQAAFSLVVASLAGALAGVTMAWLKQRFAIHEMLSGLLLTAAAMPIGRALDVNRVTPQALTIELAPLTAPLHLAPGLALPPAFVLTWGILLLSAAIALGLLFSYLLRHAVPGFAIRASGANPLAAVATGVDVERVQMVLLGVGGACAGLTGALQLWTQPAVALERWPFPLGFAGMAVAFLGFGSVRGALVAALVLAAWLNTPGAAAALQHPGWGAAISLLLLAPALWVLPRLLPEQGAPRSIWRTRHREAI
jgi:simple sugar transport system permease protein